jgi:hypothetical protein
VAAFKIGRRAAINSPGKVLGEPSDLGRIKRAVLGEWFPGPAVGSTGGLRNGY